MTKEKVKYPYIKTDFDKWVDEDEQDEVEAEGNDAAQGMDFSQMMGGAGGAGGAGGMDFSKMMGGAGGAGTPDMAQLQQLLAQSGGNLDMGDFKENDEEDEEEEIEPEVKA